MRKNKYEKPELLTCLTISSCSIMSGSTTDTGNLDQLTEGDEYIFD